MRHGRVLLALPFTLLALGAGCSREEPHGEPKGAARSTARPAAPARPTIDIIADYTRGLGADRPESDTDTDTQPAPPESYAPVGPPAPPAEIDLANRYVAAVLVSTNATKRPDGEVNCSGVLIGPGVVLTAAHCVCTPPQTAAEPPTSRTVDGSACTARTLATVVSYEPPRGGAVLRFTSAWYPGKVRPHPAFQLQLDSQGEVTSRRADLAVVLLDDPMEQAEPVGLADHEIKVGETLVLAGFMPEWPGSINYKREFIKTRVLAAARPGEGEFQVERSALSLDDINRGGPCLRATERGLVVAGLSTGDRDGSPSCASILAYRPWLAGELQNAVSVGSVRPEGSPAVTSPP